LDSVISVYWFVMSDGGNRWLLFPENDIAII
jgi:hypothetical protein